MIEIRKLRKQVGGRLALLLGTAFTLMLGLLLGMLSNNPTSIGMWGAVTMLILIIPSVLAGLDSLSRYPGVADILAYWPAAAIVKLFKLSMVSDVPSGAVMGYASAVILATAILYLLTVWMVHRSDR